MRNDYSRETMKVLSLHESFVEKRASKSTSHMSTVALDQVLKIQDSWCNHYFE